MAEKTISKHLTNLENQFSPSSPTLQKAVKTYQKLDQLEFELGLLDNDDTTARRSSWWPTVSLLGGFSTAKSEFIDRYLNTTLHSSIHKSTVLQYTPQDTVATLPGTALDADHRLPFYQVSQKIEQIATSEGSKINTYLELKTVNSERLNGKLFIDTPVLNNSLDDTIQPVLTQHILDISDLVLVFTDLFEATPILIKDTIVEIVEQQDTNKFIFIIDHSEITIDSNKSNEIIASWKRRLSDLGIHTGQFILLSNDTASLSDLDKRLANIENDRSYRVLNSLEQSIRDINDVYIPEVEDHISTWKERVNVSTLIILGFISFLLVFGEITMGIVIQFLFDPIIGPAFIISLIAVIVPIHLMISKVHAKFIMASLDKRQKKLNLNENLSGLFEKSLIFWRMIMPSKDSIGNNKKTKLRINQLIEQTKDIVQAQNDQFNYRQQDTAYNNPAEDQSNSFDNQ